MPNNTTYTAANVTTGKPRIKGCIYTAATTATEPTDAKTDLDSAVFKSLGYVGSDGVTNSNSATTTQFKDWSGVVVLESETEKADTFKLKLIESLNIDVQKAVYGDSNVTETNGLRKISANLTEMPYKMWVIDMNRGSKVCRIIIHDAKVTSVGDITYKSDDLVAYEITLSARPNSDGETHCELQESPAA